MNFFTINIVEIIIRVYTRVRFFCLESFINRRSQLKVFDNTCERIHFKAGLQPATLLKNEFFRRHFSRVLIIIVEHLFSRHLLVAASVWRNFSCLYMVFVLLYIYGILIRDKKLQNALNVAVFSLTTTLA